MIKGRSNINVRCLYSKELNCYGVRLPEGNEPLNHRTYTFQNGQDWLVREGQLVHRIN